MIHDPLCPFPIGAMVQPVPLSIPVGIVVSWEFYPAWGKWFVRVESGEVDAEGEREYALMHPEELELVPDYEQGQRDMLAKCIAAVEDLFGPDDYELRWLLDGEAVLAALRDLQEKP